MAVGADVINSDISTKALLNDAVAKAAAADVVVLAIGIAQCGCMGIVGTRHLALFYHRGLPNIRGAGVIFTFPT